MRETLTINKVTVNVPPRLQALVAEITKKNGGLYASKPKNASGDGKYVWRMLAFYVGIRPEMPVTAEFDLDEEVYWPKRNSPLYHDAGRRRREHSAYLDTKVDEILKLFPRTVERGTLRWGRALGHL